MLDGDTEAGKGFTDPSTQRAAKSEAVAGAFRLRAPFPNPAVGSVTVPFELSRKADVSITAYDALGRRVAVLAEGPHTAGRHRVTLDAHGLASGVYLVRAVVEGGTTQTATQRLTIVH